MSDVEWDNRKFNYRELSPEMKEKLIDEAAKRALPQALAAIRQALTEAGHSDVAEVVAARERLREALRASVDSLKEANAASRSLKQAVQYSKDTGYLDGQKLHVYPGRPLGVPKNYDILDLTERDKALLFGMRVGW